MVSSLLVLYIDSALGKCADLCSSQHLKVKTRLAESDQIILWDKLQH